MLSCLQSFFNPFDAYLIKGRLGEEGFKCFLFDEYTIAAHPYYANAIGGIRIMIAERDLEAVKKILELLNSCKSKDQNGEYEIQPYFDEQSMKSQLAFQWFYSRINNLNSDELENSFSEIELNGLNNELDCHLEKKNKKFRFELREFFYELLDPERRFFKYLRKKTNSFHLLNDLINYQENKVETLTSSVCPYCSSNNTRIDYKIPKNRIWISTALVLVLGYPAAVFKKQNHCFNCQWDFNLNIK